MLRVISLILLSLLSGPVAYAGVLETYYEYRGGKAYEKKEYPKAVRAFEQSLQHNPTPQTYYNLGVSQYRMNEFDKAYHSFMAAMNTEDQEIKQKSSYNLGNTLYRLGRLPESLQAYEQGLKIAPKDPMTKLNYEFVKNKLKENPEKEPEKSLEKNNQDKNQGQKSDDQKQGQQSDSEQNKSEDNPNNQNDNQNNEQDKQAKAESDQNKRDSSGQPDEKDSSPNESEQENNPEQTKKDLQGKLEAANQGQEDKKERSEGQGDGFQDAEASPEAQQAGRLLQTIQDYSQKIRDQQIKRAMGRSQHPEKDW